jgi:hypothetical protein
VRPRSVGRFKYSRVVSLRYSSARNVTFHDNYRGESRARGPGLQLPSTALEFLLDYQDQTGPPILLCQFQNLLSYVVYSHTTVILTCCFVWV